MSSEDLRLHCKACGVYYVQDDAGRLTVTSEQRCVKLAEESGDSILAYPFTCPDCLKKE